MNTFPHLGTVAKDLTVEASFTGIWRTNQTISSLANAFGDDASVTDCVNQAFTFWRRVHTDYSDVAFMLACFYLLEAGRGDEF